MVPCRPDCGCALCRGQGSSRATRSRLCCPGHWPRSSAEDRPRCPNDQAQRKVIPRVKVIGVQTRMRRLKQRSGKHSTGTPWPTTSPIRAALSCRIFPKWRRISLAPRIPTSMRSAGGRPITAQSLVR
ncbi:hypothetical protein EGW08_002446 [Elysia chlorotica]|uniref:Uncharacterized protein n=1 Tax=Elysia chlorotica TaxID=188477 RepID=A0A3S1BVJ2_ELYCH|nr:hypothetical protein EGW08_002446 [Elysia chlorotica]